MECCLLALFYVFVFFFESNRSRWMWHWKNGVCPNASYECVLTVFEIFCRIYTYLWRYEHVQFHYWSTSILLACGINHGQRRLILAGDSGPTLPGHSKLLGRDYRPTSSDWKHVRGRQRRLARLRTAPRSSSKESMWRWILSSIKTLDVNDKKL